MILDESHPDRLVWTLSTIGRYLCQSFRKELQRYSPIALVWKALWQVPTPLKVETFKWILLIQRLLLRNRLCRFQMINVQENVCSFCGNSAESISLISLFIATMLACFGTRLLILGICLLYALKTSSLSSTFGSV